MLSLDAGLGNCWKLLVPTVALSCQPMKGNPWLRRTMMAPVASRKALPTAAPTGRHPVGGAWAR